MSRRLDELCCEQEQPLIALNGLIYLFLGTDHYKRHEWLEGIYEGLSATEKTRLVVGYCAETHEDLQFHRAWWGLQSILRQQLFLTNQVDLPHLGAYLTATSCTDCNTAMLPDTKWCPLCMNDTFAKAPVFERVTWASGPVSWPVHPAACASVMIECERLGVPFEFGGWGVWMPVDVDYPPPLEQKIVLKTGDVVTEDYIKALKFPTLHAPVVMGRYTFHTDGPMPAVYDSHGPERKKFMGQLHNPPQKHYAAELFSRERADQ